MNKKKIAALALSGTLLMGAAGFGAYSWFTSQANVDANLVVNTGTLAVTATTPDADKGSLVSNGWVLQNTDTTVNDDTRSEGKVVINGNEQHYPNFVNLRPGDKLIKKVIIKNTGSLKEKVSYTVNKIVEEQYGNAVKFTIDNEDNLKNMVLYPEETPGVPNTNPDKPSQVMVTLNMTLDGEGMKGDTLNGNKVTPDKGTNYQDTTLNLNEILGNKTNIIQVNGTQVNAPTTETILGNK